MEIRIRSVGDNSLIHIIRNWTSSHLPLNSELCTALLSTTGLCILHKIDELSQLHVLTVCDNGCIAWTLYRLWEGYVWYTIDIIEKQWHRPVIRQCREGFSRVSFVKPKKNLSEICVYADRSISLVSTVNQYFPFL